MSPILGANPLDYDVTYPQVAESANDDAKIFVMERNIGKEVFFQIEDGSQYYGTISSVPNSEHYCVLINTKKLYNGLDFVWEWYVREDKAHFVEDTATEIWDAEGGKSLWQNLEV
jgi:hypothetical protein